MTRARSSSLAWLGLSFVVVRVLGAVGCVCGGRPAPATVASATAPDTPVDTPVDAASRAAASRTIPGATHVTFPSSDRDLTRGEPTAIDGWLFRPPGDGPFPAVVLLHGCAGLYRREGSVLAPRERDYAERFVREGYLALLPDSFTARGVDEICSRHEQVIRPAYERSRDAYGALAWLEAQPTVRADRVALVGWSNGAITVLDAVARKTAARPAELGHDFRVAVAFYPACRKMIAREDWLPPIAPLHILIGASDDWTPAAPCVELVDRAEKAGAPVDLVVYPGAYHDFDDPEMPVHVRHDVATTDSGTATLGKNPEARADAILRVAKILHDALAP